MVIGSFSKSKRYQAELGHWEWQEKTESTGINNMWIFLFAWKILITFYESCISLFWDKLTCICYMYHFMVLSICSFKLQGAGPARHRRWRLGMHGNNYSSLWFINKDYCPLVLLDVLRWVLIDIQLETTQFSANFLLGLELTIWVTSRPFITHFTLAASLDVVVF